MSKFVLVMTPEHLAQIDDLQRQRAVVQYMMDDITARYNDIARAVWEFTLAGHKDFTQFHDPILSIDAELDVWYALRRKLYRQYEDVARALPELTDLDEGGCFSCLDVADDAAELTGLSTDICEMSLHTSQGCVPESDMQVEAPQVTVAQ